MKAYHFFIVTTTVLALALTLYRYWREAAVYRNNPNR